MVSNGARLTPKITWTSSSVSRKPFNSASAAVHSAEPSTRASGGDHCVNAFVSADEFIVEIVVPTDRMSSRA